MSSGKQTVRYWKWPFSSLIYPLKMVIIHTYVSLPEGSMSSMWIIPIIIWSEKTLIRLLDSFDGCFINYRYPSYSINS